MSNWDNRPARQPAQRSPKRLKSTPCMTLAEEGREEAVKAAFEALAENRPEAVNLVSKLFPKNLTRIERVTPVHYADGSIACVEVRFAQTGDRPKSYRIIYRGIIENEDGSRRDGLCAGIKELADAGIYLPTNVPALLEAQRVAAEAEKFVAIFWCEGEKTRAAVEQRLRGAAAKFEELRFVPVTAATLGGGHGVGFTNYRLAGFKRDFTAEGKNSEPLHIEKHYHYLVQDNDPAGRAEAIALAKRLESLGVQRENILFVHSPSQAPLGWDDADPLPAGLSEEERLAQLLAPESFANFWHMVKTREGYIPDVSSVENRRRALMLCGVAEGFLDTSAGEEVFLVHGEPRCGLSAGETTRLAVDAIRAMGLHPAVNMLTGWEDIFRTFIPRERRDLIKEETEALIERGREMMSEENRPEQLFIRMFGLPDDEHNRLAGLHLIRDILAMRLRPALMASPIAPQLLYVFYGGEGLGKSTAVKVLAGGDPDPREDCKRYTDDIEFKDLDGTSSHGDLQLFLKLAGKTAVEFADKQLGTEVRATRAGILKHFTNKGSVRYRPMYERGLQSYNLRCVRIFTTNSPDVLTEDMGSRRWIILDLSKSTWPKASELAELSRELSPFEQMIFEGKNPGLNWVAENLPAMLAHMHESDFWRGSMHPTPEMLALMRYEQQDHRAEHNWQVQLDHELAPFEDHESLVIEAHCLADWAENRRGVRPSPQAMGNHLRARGWASGVLKRGSKPRRIWHRETTKPSRSSPWLVYSNATGSEPERWSVVDQMTAEQIERLRGSAPGEDQPF